MLLLIPIAFVSGILTVFSPCVLPILPIVLASGIDGNKKRIRGVIAGLVVSFTIASLLLATVVRFFGIPADTIRLVAVGMLGIFGLSLIFPSVWEKVQSLIERYWKFQPVQSQSSGFGGGFLTGVSLGVVWTPCIGPVLATVATLAAVSEVSGMAVIISLAYAVGVGIPLYFIAQGGAHLGKRMQFIKSENQSIRKAFGFIIIITALFIWSGADRAFQIWTLQNLPDSWTNITTTFEQQLNIDTQLQKLESAGE
jgi:cytochrome c biogenesis protein CcdA